MMTSNYRTWLDNLNEGVYYMDSDRRIKYWSKGAELITGYSSMEVMGKQCSESLLAHTTLEGNLLCRTGCLMKNSLNTGSYYKTEAYLHHKDGHKIHVSLRIYPMYDEHGNISGATHIFNDNDVFLSSHPEKVKKNYERYYDLLTDLPTRYNSELILRTKIEEFSRYQWFFATFIIEIDRYDLIKERFSGNAVDGLIKQVSSLIRNDIRPFDILGRWSECQFLIVLVNVKKEEMKLLGERVRKLVELTRFEVNQEPLTLTLSQGGALIGNGITAEGMIEKLAELTAESCRRGGNQSSYHIF